MEAASEAAHTGGTAPPTVRVPVEVDDFAASLSAQHADALRRHAAAEDATVLSGALLTERFVQMEAAMRAMSLKASNQVGGPPARLAQSGPSVSSDAGGVGAT